MHLVNRLEDWCGVQGMANGLVAALHDLRYENAQMKKSMRPHALVGRSAARQGV